MAGCLILLLVYSSGSQPSGAELAALGAGRLAGTFR